MKRIVLLLGFVFVFIIAGQPAHGCTCGSVSKVVGAKGSSVEIDRAVMKNFWLEHFDGVVFVGEVVKIEKKKVRWFDKNHRMKKVTVNVERSWVGVDNATVVIYTNRGEGGDCGVNYVKRERYFFYAPLTGGLLWTNGCSSSDPESKFADYFREILGEGKTPS